MLHLPKHRTGKHLIDRTPAKKKGSDNAEVSATPADRPKQVVIFFGTGCYKTAVGKHDFGFQQIIQCQAIFPGQITRSSTKSQPRDSGSRNATRRDSEAKTLSCLVEICLSAPRLSSHGICHRIDADRFHRREIDHQSMITDAESSTVVTSAADGDREVLLAGEIDC